MLVKQPEFVGTRVGVEEKITFTAPPEILSDDNVLLPRMPSREKLLQNPQIDFKTFQNVYANMKRERMEREKQENEGPIEGNPCSNHPYNRTQFICVKDKLGLCSECIFEHY